VERSLLGRYLLVHVVNLGGRQSSQCDSFKRRSRRKKIDDGSDGGLQRRKSRKLTRKRKEALSLEMNKWMMAYLSSFPEI